MKKQTAVDWLIENFEQQSGSYRGFVNIQTTHAKLIEQAKAMERNQIIDAYNGAKNDHHDMYLAGEYFNETYGGDK